MVGMEVGMILGTVPGMVIIQAGDIPTGIIRTGIDHIGADITPTGAQVPIVHRLVYDQTMVAVYRQVYVRTMVLTVQEQAVHVLLHVPTPVALFVRELLQVRQYVLEQLHVPERRRGQIPRASAGPRVRPGRQ